MGFHSPPDVPWEDAPPATPDARVVAAMSWLRKAQDERTNGLTANPAFIDMCVDHASACLADVLARPEGAS